MPIDPSSVTKWSKRLREAGAEAMLNAMIDTGDTMGVILSAQITHVNVDTTDKT